MPSQATEPDSSARSRLAAAITAVCSPAHRIRPTGRLSSRRVRPATSSWAWSATRDAANSPSGTGSSSSSDAMYPCTVARSANPAAAASSANRGLASRKSVSETASSPISRKYAASASDQPTKAGSDPADSEAPDVGQEPKPRPSVLPTAEQAGSDVAPTGHHPRRSTDRHGAQGQDAERRPPVVRVRRR